MSKFFWFFEHFLSSWVVPLHFLCKIVCFSFLAMNCHRVRQAMAKSTKKTLLLNYTKTLPQKLCWHFSREETKGSFSGLLPPDTGLKHDNRHFCGWVTSEPDALNALSVLGSHLTTLWTLRPHPFYLILDLGVGPKIGELKSNIK